MLGAIPAAIAPAMLSNRSSAYNKELRNKILIFITCTLALNALGIWLCIEFPHLTGVFEMVLVTLTLISAVCVFMLPNLFSKVRAPGGINHEEQLLNDLTVFNPERRVVTEYNTNQINDLLSETHVSYVTRSIAYRPLLILASGSENSYISPVIAPLLACIISGIDNIVCCTIDTTITSAHRLVASSSQCVSSILSSVNHTVVTHTHNVVTSSSEYVSSTLSYAKSKLVSLRQLIGNQDNFLNVMKFNIPMIR